MTGLSDGVLSFWLKSGVLAAASGGDGKGRHRRFDRFEVTFAAILGNMQRHGINVGALKSFGALMRRGRDLWQASGLDVSDLWYASRAHRAISQFNSPDGFRLRRDDLSKREERLAYESGNTDILYRLATTEEEVLNDVVYCNRLFKSDVVSFARTLTVADYLPLELIDGILVQLDHYDGSALIWTIWQSDGGAWGAARTTERSGNGLEVPTDVLSAIWLNVDEIVRRTWNFDNDAREVAHHALTRTELEKEAETNERAAEAVRKIKAMGRW